MSRCCLALIVSLTLALTACQMPFSPKKDKKAGDGRALALLLPTSGPHATIASKIIQGAHAARKELATEGVQIELAVIDTSAQDWLAKLQALPERFVVVGGPLQQKIYNSLRTSPVLQNKVLFAFLNNLNANDEGRIAWRFFPSPEDQVDALVSFSQDRLGIRSFGAFYPQDSYSIKMVSLFEKTVARRNLAFQKNTYQGNDVASMSRQAKVLVNPTNIGEDSLATPVPQTAFEALFLPASWRHVGNILDAFAYNGEDRLVILGTMPWEQSLSGKRLANAEKYNLCVFPSAWNTGVNVPALASFGHDFWISLGYDFVHFALNTGIHEKLSPSEVATHANRAASIVRVLAPFRWDAAGVAHQRLFIYKAAPNGIARVDTTLFMKERAERRDKSMMRMQVGGETDPLKGTPDSGDVMPEIPQKPAPAPSTIPHSSYKLRLPARPSAK
ncbi:MAG: hypothetical protein K5657_04940 [Desulfovibrio sp.]|nr:hypothetical protein [Desulfovibrio sp.]